MGSVTAHSQIRNRIVTEAVFTLASATAIELAIETTSRLVHVADVHGLRARPNIH